MCSVIEVSLEKRSKPHRKVRPFLVLLLGFAQEFPFAAFANKVFIVIVIVGSVIGRRRRVI